MEITKQGKVERTKGGPKDMPDSETIVYLAKKLDLPASVVRKFWENRQEVIDKNLLPVKVVDKKTGKKSPDKTETLNEKNIRSLLASAKSPEARQKYINLLKKGGRRSPVVGVSLESNNYEENVFKEEIAAAEQRDRIAKAEETAKNRKGGPVKKLAKGGMPDLTGDGKVTQADVLKGRGVFMKGGM